MAGAPHAPSSTGLGLTTAGAVPATQQGSLVDGSSVAVPPQIIAAPHPSAGGNFVESYALMDDDEEVMGGGCVATSSAHRSSAFVASGGSDGLSDGSRCADAPARSEPAVAVVAAGESSSGASTSNVGLHQRAAAPFVQPVTLDRRAASHVAEKAAGLHHLDPFTHIYSGENDAVMVGDDSQAVSSPEDYSAIAYDAYLHWRARRKLSSEALTQ
ncbi:hypothetical protein GGH91_005608, partial [Coemansia sp. RSA 2671]